MLLLPHCHERVNGVDQPPCINPARPWKNKYYFFMETGICMISFMAGI